MEYDVIVIGGGHAGIEASIASAKMGAKTLLITILAEQIGAASCNPAIGGLAKGHLVKEIDALGGVMGEATDLNGLQYRILNESKGPAVRGSRAQIDMDSYRIYMRNLCLNTPNLDILQEMADALMIQDGCVVGVQTNVGNEISAKKVIVTSGTFLNGKIHIGEKILGAGRVGELPSIKLSESIRSLGFDIGRLKTGTCPRVDAKTIDFSVLDKHDGDEPPKPFSFKYANTDFTPSQLPCYVAYTNDDTHAIIEGSFDRAPLFTGQIEGIGPRYCPSIEDKINRFRERERHQLFIEPQTKDATEYYINGLSTSLPIDVQWKMLRSIKGFENAKIVRFGYAIEYDYINPLELRHTLETKKLKNLYFAGQVNGTTGYEEAAAQGLMAGINAVLSIQNKEPFILRRDEAYIGVLIDDLVTKGTKEPYRMFTSRAEYRLLLREDNAIYRLSRYAYTHGMIDEARFKTIESERIHTEEIVRFMSANHITPSKEGLSLLEELGEEKISTKTELIHIIGRKSFDTQKLFTLFPDFNTLPKRVIEQILIEAKYNNYIRRQESQIKKISDVIETLIPEDFIYDDLPGLSKEVIEKLKKHAPRNLDSASRISGITPAAIDIVHMYIKIREKQK